MKQAIKFLGNKCEVSVIADSMNTYTGKRICTVQARYWRAIHSEFMTHRVFSRNASSSRAIPTSKLLAQIEEAPAEPVHWGKNQAGMQAAVESNELVCDPQSGEWLTREAAWKRAAVQASAWAQAFSDAGYHKQIVNRLIEPFSFITVVLTATEWGNFFDLRSHEDAQPDIRDLSDTIRTALTESVPIMRKKDDTGNTGWHLPYVSDEERLQFSIGELLAASAARCARTSYLTHDKVAPILVEDVKLYERLVASTPIHASPLEHQALASTCGSYANFKGGWASHRFFLEKAGSLDKFRAELPVI